MVPQRDNWRSPKGMFKWASKYFNFTLDAAASKKNALCPKYFTIKDDALTKNWTLEADGGTIWLNHPYSRNEEFIKHCIKEMRRGGNIVNLGPCDTSCAYFRLYMRHARIYLISGRVKFVGAQHSAKFASALYVFGEDGFEKKYNPEGNQFTLLKLPPRLRGGVKG